MTEQTVNSTNDIQTAARHAMKLLGAGKTELAIEQAQDILRLYPDEINSQFVLAAAQRTLGEGDLALKNLKAIVARAPDFAIAQQELGFMYADADTRVTPSRRNSSAVFISRVGSFGAWIRFAPQVGALGPSCC